jgi:hypothetical protein
MAQDHNDIYTIVEKLAILEGRITPTSVKHGLNAQQKSVPQMPALFKPKTQKILGGNPNAKNPMSGYMVGSGESVDNDQEVVEDVLDTVKRTFTEYLKNLEDELKTDPDLKDKVTIDTDLKGKDKTDRDLKVKEAPAAKDPSQNEDSELGSALSGIIPAQQPAGEEGVSIKESSPVKTVNNRCGLWEVHGDEQNGFEIRRAGRSLPTRFQDLDEATMAIEMFTNRRSQADESQDYMEEQ